MSEGSAQVSTPKSSPTVGRGRGRDRGRGSTPGSQSTVNQLGQGDAPARVYIMQQREEDETSDIITGIFTIFN